MVRLLVIISIMFLFTACKSVLYNFDGYRKVIGKTKFKSEYRFGPEYEIRVGKWTFFSCDTLYANGVTHYDRKGRFHGKVIWYSCDSLPQSKAKYKHGYRIGLYQIYHFAEGYLQEEVFYGKVPDSIKESPYYLGNPIWYKEYDSEGNVIKEWGNE